jgi:hypothetical protein
MLTNCGTLGELLISNSLLFARRPLVTTADIKIHVIGSV